MAASLKILMLCPKYPYPLRDGGAIAMMNMLRGFHKAGHQVTVLGMSTRKHPVVLKNFPEEVLRMATFHAVDVDTRVKLGDAMASFFFHRTESYHVRRFTAKPFQAELEHILSSQEFDIIQLEGLFMMTYIDTIRKHSDALVSLRAHNIEHEIWKRRASNEKQPVKNFVFMETARRMEIFEKEVYRGAQYNAFIPITGRDEGRLRKLGARGASQVIPSGFDQETLNDEKIRAEHPSVFYLGALDWEPNKEGLRWFLKWVWPRIHRLYPEVKFHIAGRRMPREFASLKGRNIVVEGEVEDAARFIKSKSIMIVPLFSGSGMRVKLIEGMAYGKAIVATPIAAEGIQRLIHGDHIFLAETEKDFARYVSILIEEKKLARTLGFHAANFCRREFDNDKLIEKLLRFYDEQLNRKKQRDKGK